jgi:hypothetical protein
MNEAKQAKQASDPALYRRWRIVRAKLEAVKTQLQRAGSVRERRRPGRRSVWVVRYWDREDSKRRYRSIYLGAEPLAERARALINRWREEKITPRERIHRGALRDIDLSAAALGYSERARKRLRKSGEEAVGDTWAMVEFVFNHPDPSVQFGHSPGRPSKSGLW